MLQNSPAGKPKKKGIVCFVPSFSQSNWDVVLGSGDGPADKLTYLEHRTLQNEAGRTLQMQGVEVREICMDPLKMLSWRRKNKLRNDQQGRLAYYADAGRCADLRLPEPS